MEKTKNGQDVKRLFAELNSLTDLMSAARGSTKPVASGLYVKHSKRPVFEYPAPSQPVFRYPSMANSSSTSFKKPYTYNSATFHTKSSHRFTNPNVFNISQNRSRYFSNSSHMASNQPVNSRYSKTNISTVSASTSGKSASCLLAKYSAQQAKSILENRILNSSQKADCIVEKSDRSNMKQERVHPPSQSNSESIKQRSESIKIEPFSGVISYSVIEDQCHQLLHDLKSSVVDSEVKHSVSDILNKILCDVGHMCGTMRDTQQDMAEEDAKVLCHPAQGHQKTSRIVQIGQFKEKVVHTEDEVDNSSASHQPSRVADIEQQGLEIKNFSNTDRTSQKTIETRNLLTKIGNKKICMNSRYELADPLQLCSSKKIWKTKYKVVNKHLDSGLAKSSSAHTIISDSTTKITKAPVLDPKSMKSVSNKIPSNNPVVKNKYKLVNAKKNDEKKETPGTKVTRARKSSVGKMTKIVRSPLLERKADNQNQIASDLCKSSAWEVSSSGLNRTRKRTVVLVNQGTSQAKSSKKTQDSWSEALTEKLNELELETRSLYKGYDLSLISPMELVALDHTTLLKIAAAQKKPESFVKKSKYKIVSESKSSVLEAGQIAQKKKLRSKVGQGKIPTQTFRKSLGQGSSKKRARPVLVQSPRFQSRVSSQYVKLGSRKLSRDFTKLYKRADFGGKTCTGVSPGVLKSTPPPVRNLASRVLNRSIKRASAASCKKPSPNSSAYCIFFNRFGKCNRAENCPFIHDPSKIAVCTRFLRGSCKVNGCPFSHEINPGKMAICSFFLQGACKKNESCPYRHETLKPGTELCKAFVKGYCPNGSQCGKAHILICPDYARGNCERGDECHYPHPPRKAKRKLENEFVDLKKAKKEVKEEVGKQDEAENEDFRYFSHDPITGEIKFIDGEDTACLPNTKQMSSLPQYIPFHIKTEYIPEHFDDAECLE